MEETNVTMTTEEMQGEPAAKENETKAEKFIRIGEYRMNKAVDAIGRLENLANRSFYEYTQEQVDAMFQALEGRVVEGNHLTPQLLTHLISTKSEEIYFQCLIRKIISSWMRERRLRRITYRISWLPFCRIYDRKENCVREKI